MSKTKWGKRTRPRVTVKCTREEGKTKQEFQPDTDINKIIARYKRTGVLPSTGRDALAQYGDVSQVPDFQAMHDKVMAANEAFNTLPAKLRKEYGNDAGQFLAALQGPEGDKLAIELGLKDEPVIDKSGGDDPPKPEPDPKPDPVPEPKAST